MIDYNNVKQTIATNLPDNNKQEITAEKLRSTLNEFVDKVVETETGIENNTPKIVDSAVFASANSIMSTKWGNAIAALTGLGDAECYGNFSVEKVTNISDGYIDWKGNVVYHEDCSYFELWVYEGEYITLPLYHNYIESDGGYIAFYDENGDFISAEGSDDPFTWNNMHYLTIQAPYGSRKVRGSLVNGTFDKDNLYVVKSSCGNHYNEIYDLCTRINDNKLPLKYKRVMLGTNGEPISDTNNSIAVVKLYKNDELEVECWGAGAKLAIGSSNILSEEKTVIYPDNNDPGWLYYKADKDCYAFIVSNSGAHDFKVIHNDYFDSDLQYQLAALAKNIKPSFGRIKLNNDGKGMYQRWDMPYIGTKHRVVFKIPILAGTTLNYTLHSSGTFTLGDVGYWYFGQPVPTESIENQVSFSDNTISIVGGSKSGYALVTMTYSGSGDIPSAIFDSTYLEKVTV